MPKAQKNIKKVVKNNKKPLIIGAIGAGAVALAVGLGKAFASMRASAKAQHEVDKAEFDAAKAEAKERIEAANARYEAAKK